VHNRTLAIRVDVTVPDSVINVMRHAAHILPMIAGARTIGVDRRANRGNARIVAARVCARPCDDERGYCCQG
jgi:hypothetical protein